MPPADSVAPSPLSPIVAGVWRMDEWNFDVAARQRWVEHCLALGITTFDHADIYGDYQVERLFGEVLAAAPGLRDSMQLVTKFGIKLRSVHRPSHGVKAYDTSRQHIIDSVDASLRALHTDRIDLLLIHRPDVLMDPAEVAETFHALRASGKVLHFGVSNHTPAQFARLHRCIPLITNQVELSPLQLGALGDGSLDQCLDLGIRPMIWSPLAGGRLVTSTAEDAVRVRTALQALATQHGVTATTIAYAWLLRHPSRPTPMTGSRRIEALQEAVAALAVTLSREEWYRVWEAGAGHEVA